MSIDQIINESIVGKFLVLYKVSWIEHEKTKKHDDIWKSVWRVNQEIGKYKFGCEPRGIHFPGTLWSKANLNSMTVERCEYVVRSVEINDYEEYNTSMTVTFDLLGFPFTCSYYDEFELKTEMTCF